MEKEELYYTLENIYDLCRHYDRTINIRVRYNDVWEISVHSLHQNTKYGESHIISLYDNGTFDAQTGQREFKLTLILNEEIEKKIKDYLS